MKTDNIFAKEEQDLRIWVGENFSCFCKEKLILFCINDKKVFRVLKNQEIIYEGDDFNEVKKIYIKNL